MRALLILFLFAGQVHAKCDWPVPDYKIDESVQSGLTKAQFDRAISTAERAWSSTFANWGCPLVMHHSWSNGTINAQAWQEGGYCHVEMFGGLARFPGMTERTFVQVAMHEIGHHIGGRPYYSGERLSVEGQADYFSTAWGMPKAGLGSMGSSLILSRVLARLSGEALPWRPGPVLPPAGRTIETHPPAQCRLNTMDVARRHGPRHTCWFKSLD